MVALSLNFTRHCECFHLEQSIRRSRKMYSYKKQQKYSWRDRQRTDWLRVTTKYIRFVIGVRGLLIFLCCRLRMLWWWPASKAILIKFYVCSIKLCWRLDEWHRKYNQTKKSERENKIHFEIHIVRFGRRIQQNHTPSSLPSLFGSLVIKIYIDLRTLSNWTANEVKTTTEWFSFYGHSIQWRIDSHSHERIFW